MAQTRTQMRGSTLHFFTRASIRAVDACAISRFGIPEAALMENAARELADVTLDLLTQARTATPRILIICGTGNNGGDGLAAARHLSNAGCKVNLLLTGTPRPGTLAAQHLKACREMGILIVKKLPARLDCIIDAIFGTGLDRALDETTTRLIDAVNQRGERGTLIIAADIPTGIDADTGNVLGAAIVADLTVTFAGFKQGMLTPIGAAHCGDVIIGDIGAPASLIRRLGKPLKLPQRP